MKTGDRIKFRDARHPVSRGLNMAAVGVVVRTYDLPAHPFCVDVEFAGLGLLEGWPQAEFVVVDRIC